MVALGGSLLWTSIISTHCSLGPPYGEVNTGSGNGLLPNVTKPLPEQILTYQQRCSVTFTWKQFYRKCSWSSSGICVRRLHLKNDYHIFPGANELTHWGRVTHICVGKLSIIGSDNGLSPNRRQAIIWTNAGILLIWNLATNFSEILSEIHTFSFKKMHLKLSSAKWLPCCLGLNVLKCRSRIHVRDPD